MSKQPTFFSIYPIFIFFAGVLLSVCGWYIWNLNHHITTQSSSIPYRIPYLTTTGSQYIFHDPLLGTGFFENAGGSMAEILKYRETHLAYITSPIEYQVSNSSPYSTDINLYTTFSGSVSDADIVNLQRVVQSHEHCNLKIIVSGREHLNEQGIQRVLPIVSECSDIQIDFFDFPQNYFRVFENISWKKNMEKNISIVIHGPQFPYGFSIASVIQHARDMIERSNKKIPITSFSIELEESESIYFMIREDEGPNKLIQNFPTRKWSSDTIILDPRSPPPGDGPNGSARIKKWFQESPIESIYMDMVGKKENGIIELFGF